MEKVIEKGTKEKKDEFDESSDESDNKLEIKVLKRDEKTLAVEYGVECEGVQ